jgi:hypothetical protein
MTTLSENVLYRKVDNVVKLKYWFEGRLDRRIQMDREFEKRRDSNPCTEAKTCSDTQPMEKVFTTAALAIRQYGKTVWVENRFKQVCLWVGQNGSSLFFTTCLLSPFYKVLFAQGLQARKKRQDYIRQPIGKYAYPHNSVQ